LHVIAVLYGRFLSAHGGQMPADQQELIDFINENEKDLLFRRGIKSAEELFEESAGQGKVLVLYRDHRERLQTEFVAIEEQRVTEMGGDGQIVRSKWFAADALGAAQEIDKAQAKRVLAEAG
jgi:hypothetical protein